MQRCTLYVVFHNEALNGWNQTEHGRILKYYGVNPKFTKSFTHGLPAPLTDPIMEYELPKYDESFQKNLYKENSFFFHLYKNWDLLTSNPAHEFIGLMQYDMILNKDFCEGLSNGALLDANTVYVSFWNESPFLFDTFFISQEMVNLVELVFQDMVDLFEWSFERPAPTDATQLFNDKLYLLNAFCCEKKILERYVHFLNAHEISLERFRQQQTFLLPQDWASMLERLTCLYFLLLERSETGKHLSFQEFKIDQHFAGEVVDHVDCDGTIYKSFGFHE